MLGSTATKSTSNISLEMVTTAAVSSSSPSKSVSQPTVDEPDDQPLQPGLPARLAHLKVPSNDQPVSIINIPPEDHPVDGLTSLKTGLAPSPDRHSVLAGAKLPCGMTRFHLSLLCGMIGFVIFWVGLLLRIYMPHDFWGKTNHTSDGLQLLLVPTSSPATPAGNVFNTL